MKTLNQPLYKIFLRLRCNPQSREKLFAMDKQKWKKLIKSLLMSKKLAKLLYDQFLYFKSPKSTVVKAKNNYREELIAKQRFKLLFGGLIDKHFSKSQMLRHNPTCKSNFILASTNLRLFEQRLDNILYEAGFVRSLRGSRQLISKNAIIINGIKVSQPSHTVQLGDCLEIDKRARHLTAINTSLSLFRKIPHSHLHINYRTLNLYVAFADISHLNQYNYFLGLRAPLKL